MSNEKPQDPYVPEPTEAIVDRILVKHRGTSRAGRVKRIAESFDRGILQSIVILFAKTRGIDYEAAHRALEGEPVTAAQ